MIERSVRVSVGVLLVLLTAATLVAQSTATLQGSITDSQGALLPGVSVTIRNTETGVERSVGHRCRRSVRRTVTGPGTLLGGPSSPGLRRSDDRRAARSRTGRRGQRQARACAVEENVTVTGSSPLIETATVSVGQVMAERTVQEIPLNGRHFVDLGPLMPGGVTPPQNAGLSAPLRGQGSFSFFSAGNRETSVELHDQRHQPERSVEQPGHVPAVDQYRLRIQGGQLDVQRRVRPQLGRHRERGDPLGRQPDARRSVRVLSRRPVRLEELLQSRRRTRVAVQPEAVRLQRRRTESSETRRSTSSATKGCATRRASISTPACSPRRNARRWSTRCRRTCWHIFRSATRSDANGQARLLASASLPSRSISGRAISGITSARRTTFTATTPIRKTTGRNRTRRATPCPASAIRAAASGRC